MLEEKNDTQEHMFLPRDNVHYTTQTISSKIYGVHLYDLNDSSENIMYAILPGTAQYDPLFQQTI